MNLAMLVLSLLLSWGAIWLLSWRNHRWEQKIEALHKENNRLMELYLKSIYRELQAHEQTAYLGVRLKEAGLES